jgi:hypothetical protein
MKNDVTVSPFTTGKPNGVIIYEDFFRVSIAIFNSDNRKTGNMIQVYILARDKHPVEVVRDHEDDVICGTCPLRGGNGCYVEVWQGPSQVYKSYRAGKYPVYSENEHSTLFTGRAIRWGAYGDPVYIPFEVIAYFNALAENWTGYTHQWRECADVYKNVFMASVEELWQMDTAIESGWRTFRIETESYKKQGDEIYCPASPEGGNKTHCVSCGLCNGSRGENDPRKNIVIKPHGKRKEKFLQIGA